MIAAGRALEDEEECRLFDDPLARVLAGEKAMQRAVERSKVGARRLLCPNTPRRMPAPGSVPP